MSTDSNPSAMLISLTFNFGKSGGEDKAITKELCDKYGASNQVLKGNKRTFCKEATAPLRKLTNEWKSRLRRFAPPWDIPSMFLCKPMNVAKAIALRDEYIPALDTLKVAHLLERYDYWKELTKSQLHSAYKEEEFPSREELIADVGWSMGIMPLPDSEAIRRIKNLGGDDIMDALTASHNERVQQGIKAGMAEAYTQLMEPLQHMVDTLKQPDKIIRESLVANVRNVIAEIPGLNLTDDSELARFASEAEALLASLDTESLRELPVVRQATADKAAAILATFGAVGLRKFAA